MIQIVINGNRNDEIVPKTTESIVESAILSIKKGATSVHFHPRDTSGNETLKGEFVDKQISELRKRLKQIPIGISTGEWIEPDFKKRLEQIRLWENLPDFVSINYDEFGFKKITELISEKGIQIEVGLSNIESVQNFTQNNLKGDFLRVLIEPQEQVLDSSLQTIRKIEKLINNSGIKLPILLHGVDRTCWNILKLAIEKKYQTRIGFEDTLTLPNGEKAISNMELMEQAQQINDITNKVV